MVDSRAELQKCLHIRRLCESRFHNIVNNSLDGILIVSGDGDILSSNPSAIAMFGLGRDELQGSPFGFPIIGADRPTQRGVLGSGNAGGGTEWDGQRAFLTQLRGITQRKHSESIAQAYGGESRLASKVFENSNEGILILDARNQAFSRMTGFSPEDIVGREPAELWMDKRGNPCFRQVIREALNQRGNWQGEVECRGKDGRGFPGWVSSVVVRDSLGTQAALGRSRSTGASSYRSYRSPGTVQQLGNSRRNENHAQGQ